MHVFVIEFGNTTQLSYNIVAIDAKTAIDIALYQINKKAIDVWKLSDISLVKKGEKVNGVQGLL